MNVIICGAGQVGISLMRYLISHNYIVTVIDHDQRTINQINERFDARAIYGHASDPLVLKAGGITDTDIIIAVTQSDEINILICTLCNTLYKVPMRIARIRNQLYHDSKLDNLFANDKLNIDYVISPEIEVAHAIADNLTIEGAFTAIQFANNKFYLIGVKVTSATPIVNTPVLHAASLYPEINFSIMGIRRNDENFIANEHDIIKADDEIYFLVATKLVFQVMTIFGYDSHTVKKIIIVGGGNIGAGLAHILEKDHKFKSLTIIENQLERAHLIAQSLNQTTIINGDALDNNILDEANISQADIFIAVTDDDKVNILGALLAKKAGARRSMALINRVNFRSLSSSLGIDALIFPPVITVSKILQCIREQNIKQVYTLGEGFGEVVEVDAYHSNLIGLSINEIDKDYEIRVLGILRENEALIPNKTTVIKNSDSIIIAISAHLSEASRKLIQV